MVNTSRYQSVDWPAKLGEPCGRIPRGVFRSDQVSSLLTSRTSSKNKPTNSESSQSCGSVGWMDLSWICITSLWARLVMIYMSFTLTSFNKTSDLEINQGLYFEQFSSESQMGLKLIVCTTLLECSRDTSSSLPALVMLRFHCSD